MVQAQQILPSDKVTIIIDSRELQSNVARSLENFNVKLIPKQLKVADYITSDKTGIERKTTADFLQSVFDRRIFQQLETLANSFEKPILIIEGNPESLFLERNVHPNAIHGILAVIALDFRIPTIWTQSSKQTAAQIYWIACREQLKEKRGLQIRVSKKAFSLAQQQEFIIAGLPFVSTKLSKRLLKKFGSVKKVFNAKEEKLKKVKGLGKIKAKKIFELINARYEK